MDTDWTDNEPVFDNLHAGKIVRRRTIGQHLRIAIVGNSEDHRVYHLFECNPHKVQTDSEGNTAKDKVMVKWYDKEGWIGQVRRYRNGKEDWHYHLF